MRSSNTIPPIPPVTPIPPIPVLAFPPVISPLDCSTRLQEFDFHYEKRDNLSDANIRDFVFQEIRTYHNPITKPRKK